MCQFNLSHIVSAIVYTRNVAVKRFFCCGATCRISTERAMTKAVSTNEKERFQAQMPENARGYWTLMAPIDGTRSRAVLLFALLAGL